MLASELVYGISADTTAIRAQLGQVNDLLAKMSQKANTEASKMGEGFSKLGSVVAGAFSVATISAFGVAAVKSAGQVELATAKLETLLGSRGRAQEMVSDIIKMADTTPYGGEELIKAATTLKGFGVETDQIMTSLTALGNAAGGNADNMSRLALVVGQVRAQNRLLGSDVYQFVNAGVPLYKLLSESMKKPTTEIKNMIEAGKVGYKEVNAALQEFYTGNGKYADLMEKAAATLPGMFSTMNDSMMAFGRELVDVFTPALKDAMSGITETFTALVGWLREASPELKQTIATVGKFAAIFMTAVGAIAAVRGAWMLLNTVMAANPFGLILTLVGSLIYALSGLNAAATSNADLTLAENKRMSTSVKELEATFDSYSQKVSKTGGVMSSAWDLVSGNLSDAQKKQKELIASTIEALSDNLNSLGQLTYGTEEYSNAIADINAQYAFLHKNSVQAGMEKSEKVRVETLMNAYKGLKTEKDKANAPKDPKQVAAQAAADAEEKRRIQERKKLLNDLNLWELEQRSGKYARDVEELYQKYEKELAIVGQNEDAKAQLYAKYQQDIDNLQKNSLDSLGMNAAAYANLSLQLQGVFANGLMAMGAALYDHSKSFKAAVKEMLLNFVTMVEQTIVLAQIKLMVEGWAWSISTLGASVAAAAVAMAKVAAAVVILEGVKAGIRQMATGGIVTGPTMALVGEGKDDEAVLPLNTNTFASLADGIVNQLDRLGGTNAISNNQTTVHTSIMLDGKVIGETVDVYRDDKSRGMGATNYGIVGAYT